MIDIVAMEQAVLVLHQGSFRKAAALLHVRPSVVSRRVRLLEEELGVGLFQRLSLGVVPTPAGHRILIRTRKILDELELLVRTARLSGEGTEGSLSIGVASSVAGGTGRRLLAGFRSTHSEVDLRIVEGSPRDHIAAVAALCMDAAFVVGVPRALGCEIDPLWTERLMVAFPERHSLAVRDREIGWGDLSDERFLVSKTNPGPEIEDLIVRHLAVLGRHPDVEPHSVGRDTLLVLVGFEMGISLVSEALASIVFPGVVFRSLVGGELPFSVIWSTKNDNPTLRRFLSRSRIEVKRIAAERDQMVDASGKPDPSP